MTTSVPTPRWAWRVGVDRPQDVEVALDAAGLRARRHHAAVDRLDDVERRRSRSRTRWSTSSFSSPTPSVSTITLPRKRRRSQPPIDPVAEHRHPGPAGVVERAVRAVPLRTTPTRPRPRSRRRSRSGPASPAPARRSSTGRPSHADRAASSVGHRAVGQLDLDAGSPSTRRARGEQQLGHPAGREREAGRRGRRAPTAGRRRCRGRRRRPPRAPRPASTSPGSATGSRLASPDPARPRQKSRLPHRSDRLAEEGDS